MNWHRPQARDDRRTRAVPVRHLPGVHADHAEPQLAHADRRHRAAGRAEFNKRRRRAGHAEALRKNVRRTGLAVALAIQPDAHKRATSLGSSASLCMSSVFGRCQPADGSIAGCPHDAEHAQPAST